MKITTRLILSFLLVSILPLAIAGYAGLRGMHRIGDLVVDESSRALTDLGERAIRQKALSVAGQMALYLQAHPDLLAQPAWDMVADETLAATAVQPVGQTGYTAVYDSDGVVYFHANSALVGRNMQELAGELPAFWAIFESSLDGTVSSGYYAWQDADGAIRDKYMSCVPVGDTPLRVAATTYIDEFSRPAVETGAEIAHISREAQSYLILSLVAVGLVGLILALWLAWGISRPVQRLILAAKGLEQGLYRPESLRQETSRRDDLGTLACVFDRMAREVQAREARLHRQIEELTIQIDEAKRDRQVSQITDTEYFQALQRKARQLRGRGSGQDNNEDSGCIKKGDGHV